MPTGPNPGVYGTNPWGGSPSQADPYFWSNFNRSFIDSPQGWTPHTYPGWGGGDLSGYRKWQLGRTKPAGGGGGGGPM